MLCGIARRAACSATPAPPPPPPTTENWRCSSNGNVSKVLLDDRAWSPIRLNNELRTCFKSKILEKLQTPSSIDSRCEGNRDAVSISLNAEAPRSEVLPASPVPAGSAPFRVPSAGGCSCTRKRPTTSFRRSVLACPVARYRSVILYRVEMT